MISEQEVLLTFKAASEAIRAEEALLTAGINPRVTPLPAQIAEGCGITLKIFGTDVSRAKEVLAPIKAIPKAVWRFDSQENSFIQSARDRF